MPKKKIKKLKKNIIKVLSVKRKNLLILLTTAFVVCLSLGIYLINRPKPNGDILLQNTASESIFTNKNPEFSVEFGKREEPHEQWVRFEAKGSTKNPFKEEKENVWNKILNAVKPKKNLGIEMSLSGVELSQTESISDEEKVEKLKSVAEVLGTDTVETNTELVDLGRTIWNGEEEDVSRKTIVNRDVVKGVDLIYQIIDGVGLKEEIVIKDLEEYTSECGEDVSNCAIPLNEFVFDLKLDDGVTLKKGWYTIENSSAETYYFEDEKGNYIAHFLPSFAIDGGGEKTSNVKMDVEEVGEREYKIKVTIDIGWLLSEDRIFPVRIDPSIVHNSKSNFDTGEYSQIEYSDAVGGVELLGVDRVGVDSNTVGYWNFDKGVNDRSGNGNDMITSLYGIQYGIRNSSLTFVLNQYNGASNPGEIDITCPNGDANCYVYDMAGNRLPTPTINSGIAVTDTETGSGYIMYSPSLSAQGITSTEGSVHTNHFIAVHYTGTTWQYNNNSTWVNFTPTANNILVAEITFFTSINMLDIWPTQAEGRINDGYEFDGVNDYVKVNSLSGLTTGTPVHTIEAWIKPGEFDSLGRRQWPLLLGDASDGNIHWTYNREGTIGVGVWGAAQCGIPVTMNEWSYISVSYDGTTFRCYKNGEFFGNAIGDTSLLNLTSTVLTLGKKAISGEAYFNGSIDEVKISKVARSAEEIYRSYLQSKEKFSGEYVSTVFDSDVGVSSASVSGIVSGISTGNGEIPYSTTGLVAQWNFNETSGTIANSGGSCGSTCNGTLTNFADTSGQDKVVSSGWTYNNRRWGNGALMFDGSNDYILVPNNSSIAISNAISIEVWINPLGYSQNDYNHIVDKDGNYSLSIYNGKLGFYVGNPTGWWYPDVPIPLNEWSHVVVSFVGGNRRMYVNGVMVAEMSDPYTIFVNNSATFSIGSRQNGTLKYWGTIDTVRVYNRALSASEVLSNYNSNSVKYFVRGGDSVDPNDGTWGEWNDSTNRESTIKSFDNKYLYDERENGLVSYWTMDEDSGNTVVDARGINNGTATGTTIADGKYSKGRDFDGAGNYVRIPNSSSLDINGSGSKISIAFWANLRNLPSFWGTFLYKASTNTGDVNAKRQYGVFINSSGGIEFDSTSVENVDISQTSLTGSSMVSTNTWNYIVGVIDSVSGYMKLYLNGKEIGSTTYSTTGIRQGSGDVFLGINNSDGSYVLDDTVMDEVRIYNTALSSDKILYDYLEGIEKRDSVISNSSILSAEESNTIDDGLVSYWNMDEESGSVVRDSVGINNGTATGTTIVDGKVNKGRSFDGTDDYITLPSGLSDFTEGLTISLWANPTSNGSYARFVDFGEPDGSVSSNIILNRENTSNFLTLTVGNGSTYLSVTAPNGIINNEWHLYTATISESGVGRIYRDGVLLSDGQLVVPANVSRTYNYIGKSNYSADSLYQGYIDEVRIYNIAKTKDEIQRMYNEGLEYRSNRVRSTIDDGLVSYWNMDEESGSVVKDSVGINNGTATGTTIVDGKVNKGRSFDGVDDYVRIPNSSSLDINGSGSQVSIAFWVKLDSMPSSWGTLLYKGSVNTGDIYSHRQYGLYVHSSGILELNSTSVNNADVEQTYVQTSQSLLSVNNWSYVVGVVDSVSGYLKIYVNGEEVASTSYSTTGIRQGSGDVFLGINNSDGSYVLDGVMDEVRIYNRALSSEEIFDAYTLSKETFDRKNDGLVSYWNMDETSGTSVKDSIGINNGIATGTTIVNGKVNNGRSFDGVDDYVGISNNIDLKDKSFVVSAWVKRNRNGTAEYFFGQGASTVSNSSLFIGFRASGAFVCGFWNNDLETTTTYPEIGEWHYYACTYDASTKLRVLYRDGIQVTSGTASANYQGVGVSVIGGVSSGATPSQFMSGSIDEVKIFNRVLSSAEIAEEYIEGVDRHSTSQSSYVNYQIQQSNISNKISLPVYIAGDDPGEYISVTTGESAYANYQPDANTVGLWHLDEIDGNGPYIKDSSGNGHEGTPIGSTYISDGKVGGARKFNGSSDYIVAKDIDLANKSFTVSFWSKRNQTNGTDEFILSIGDAYSANNVLPIGYRGTDIFTFAFFANDLNTAQPYPDLDGWHFWGCTFDSSTKQRKIYRDGVLVASDVATSNFLGSGTLRIGLYGSNISDVGAHFGGSVDEVYISNIVRSPDEIRQAYEVGLRTHNVEIEFGAKLDNSNPIASSTDKSFSINGIAKGMLKMGSNIYAGEKIIVREQKDTGEYIAQGIVNSINEDTGAVTVSSWDTVSTFPSGGFSSNADVFKWQKEYIPVKGRTLDTHLDQAKLLTLRVDNAYGGRNVWIDNLTSDEYVTPSPQDIINLGKSYRFFQYKAVLMSTDPDTSPIISQIQLDYTPIPPMNRIMRHGQWFLSGTKQPFWWAK